MDSIAGLFGQTEQELAREITDSVNAQLPAEKARAEREMVATARGLKARGSSKADGRGQAIGSIPPIVYLRWAAMVPGFWQNKAEVEAFLFDNPQCCAPGYKPRSHSLRHSMTFSNTQYHQIKNKTR